MDFFGQSLHFCQSNLNVDFDKNVRYDFHDIILRIFKKFYHACKIDKELLVPKELKKMSNMNTYWSGLTPIGKSKK